MPIRTLLPALSLALNIASIPVLAQTVPAATTDAPSPAAERTMAQNRSVALPAYEIEAPARAVETTQAPPAPISLRRLAGTGR